MSDDLIEHKVPQKLRPDHYIAIAVPRDFADVIIEAGDKNKLVFEEQLLAWAQMGAECSRLHRAQDASTGRKNNGK